MMLIVYCLVVFFLRGEKILIGFGDYRESKDKVDSQMWDRINLLTFVSGIVLS